VWARPHKDKEITLNIVVNLVVKHPPNFEVIKSSNQATTS
jgi:hypothetical protein